MHDQQQGSLKAGSAAQGSGEPAASLARPPGRSSLLPGESEPRSPGKAGGIGRGSVQGKSGGSEPGHVQPPAQRPAPSSRGAHLPNGHAAAKPAGGKRQPDQAAVKVEQPSSNGAQGGNREQLKTPKRKKRRQPVAANGAA